MDVESGLGRLITKYWDVFAGLLLGGVLGATHVYATWTWPLPRLVFREGSLTYFDRGGAEATTHIDRLATYGAMKACEGSLAECFPLALEAADRHHPPVTALSAALWNHIVGLGIPETLLLNLVWLGILLGSVHAMARRMSGPLGGWMATLLVASAPVILGPSRLLHQDLTMTALLALFGALLMALGQSARLRWVPAIAIVGTLAVLTKWEMVVGIGSAGLAGGFFALTQPKRYKTIPALVVAAGCLLIGLHTYVKHIPSYSFDERPQLEVIEKPQYTWYFIRMALDAPEDDQPPPSVELDGSFSERLLFYLEAAPASAVGALPSLFMVLGLGIMVAKRQWVFLAFGGGWIVLGLATLGAFVTGFGDDRFVHFYILPLAALGGAGLSRSRAAPLFLGLVALTFLLHLGDMTLPSSPLPSSPSIKLPRPGDYLERPREVSLRPNVPYGHGTWVRPETRAFNDLGAIREALRLSVEGGASRLNLAPDTQGTTEATYLWVLESLLMDSAPPIGLRASSIAHGFGYEARCFGLSKDRLEREFAPGTWLVVDAEILPESQDLSALPWNRLTCGYLSNPQDQGLRPRLVTTIKTERDVIALIELGARPEPSP